MSQTYDAPSVAVSKNRTCGLSDSFSHNEAVVQGERLQGF